ncbi:hypothetical protein UFOVP9_29 [uncultured Caudovirales phage]|jgi:hypothetical protein|uniref:Uncharacterized protein n=1 Tax=uncultured Caudovirales phage TaxID=2100421 RepID=A0A6J5KLL7_9CAUD|nr:hypothetical protein UFOVP9_29 [uncultured Caudovirales phage]
MEFSDFLVIIIILLIFKGCFNTPKEDVSYDFMRYHILMNQMNQMRRSK